MTSDYEIHEEPNDIVAQARSLYKRDKESWSEVYDRAKEDLFFLSDDECAQWVEKEYNNRIKTGRPALTIDQLSQFIHQVVNDIRQNTPAINVIAGDEEADEDTAHAFQSIIRGIEYKSKADIAYDTAASFSVKSSIGFIRVDHKYSNNYSFDQELVINRVINPLSIIIDSDSIELDGSDAKHAHALEKMTVDQFKKRWPGKEVSCYASDQEKFTDRDHVFVCEFYKLEEEKKTIKDENGKIKISKEDEDPKGRTREVTKTKVLRYWLSGKEVLEETKFPGKYIPIVPVYGEEAWEDGKRHLFSLIRKSKGAQMMFNLWKSLETELLLKQPQAPVMAPAGAIENYKADWIDPSKTMALRYDQMDEEGRPYNKPERLSPPQIPTGIVNAARETVDDIKATLGMYNASIGRRGTATSGIQEQTQQKEGDVATYHFGDNLRVSINHIGCILVSAAPEIYDTDRILMGINVEDEHEKIGINGKMAEGQERPIDLSKGQYEVRVISGPSFTTQRQETSAVLAQLFQTQPQLMEVYGDLYFKNSDFAGAEAMAERAKKLIQKTNPELIEGEDGQQAPDPRVAQMQQIIQQGVQEIQTLQQQLQQAQEEIKSKQLEQQVKAQDTQSRAQVDVIKTKQQSDAAQMDFQIKQAQLALDAEDLEIKKTQLALSQQDLELKKLQAQIQIASMLNLDDEDAVSGHLQTIRDKKARDAQAQSDQQQADDAERMRQQQMNPSPISQVPPTAMLEGIDGIKQMIGGLTAAIKAPKSVVYNPDGSINSVK